MKGYMNGTNKNTEVKEIDNAFPMDIQLWSDRLEVDSAVDAIFAECAADSGIRREHVRMKTCLKVVLLNLLTCHASDPTRFIRYSRHNVSWMKCYNCLDLSAVQVRQTVDRLTALKYVTGKLGKRSSNAEGRRQSRVRAEDVLIQRIKEFDVSPLMATIHPDANLIILKDADKKRMEYEPTVETNKMQEELKTVNSILSKTLVNLYMPDKDLHKLNKRMRTGKIPECDVCNDDQDEIEENETPRGCIDFTRKALRRVFNHGVFDHGGRLYGGWWQRIPRADRKYIRINRMNTAEVDFSSLHVYLVYWLEGLPLPEGDLYSLDGFPEGTRDVVKKCLLTIINSTDRVEAMASIKQRVKGYKYKSEKINGRWEKKRIEFNEKVMNVNYFYRSTTIIIPVLLPPLRIAPVKVLERLRQQPE